jgi:hypothetical protein
MKGGDGLVGRLGGRSGGRSGFYRMNQLVYEGIVQEFLEKFRSSQRRAKN